MPLEIKTSAFCGLSRSQDWQAWLSVEAPDLLADLVKVVTSGKGCRANSDKMMEIYFELLKRNKQASLETFVRRRFPWIVKSSATAQAVPKKTTPPVIPKVGAQDFGSLNKHGVFKSYRPDILSFPRKLIIIDKADRIYSRVQRFIYNKLGADYLIIGNYAYIEYFEPKDAAIVDKIPRESRDIYKYRQKMAQEDAETSVNNS